MSFKRSRSTYEDHGPSSGLVSYGVALQCAGNGHSDGSFVPTWKQEAVDDRGRKRFHGAFTGGFSAGYFNTVGSKEGWAPSTFVSSRTARAKATLFRPEDFMDHEDLQAAEEERHIEMSDQFTGMGSGMVEKAFVELLVPNVEQTKGWKLLRKMERGTDRANNRGAAELSGGVSPLTMPSEPAPRLSTLKVNNTIPSQSEGARSGLGYLVVEPIKKFERDSVVSTSRSRQTKPATIRGVGSFDADDLEEEDLYQIRPITFYNKVATESRPSNPPRRLSTKAKHTFAKKALASSSAALRTCSDGSLPIRGFVLGSSASASARGFSEYPAPQLPVNWLADKQSTAPAPSVTRHYTDHLSRAQVLGEAQLPGKSVFDYLTPKARDHIASLTGKTNLPIGRGEALPSITNTAASSTQVIPDLDPSIAAAALHSESIPYMDDPDKCARYRGFLEIKAFNKTDTPLRKPSVSAQDWAKELAEFAAAAHVFKPLGGGIADRFTTAKISTSGQSSARGERVGPAGAPISNVSQPLEDPAVTAANMSMHGRLTRSVSDFMPHRLLCKRFNIQPPKVSLAESAPHTKKEATAPPMVIGQPQPPIASRNTEAYAEKGRTLDEERAADEVFQAVFG